MEDLMNVAIDYLCMLNNLGYDAYIVGGAVRDKLRGMEVYDVDVATNCPMHVLEKNLNTHDIGKSKDFGILLVLYKKYQFETAQFRTESGYSDGRRPDKVKIADNILSDLSRRDFTVNAMALDKDGIIIDPFGGQKDLQNKLIRSVGNPMARFDEDRLRMIRAARFGAMEGFSIERDTRLAIRRLAFFIDRVSKERVRMELVKAADLSKPGKEFAKFIQLLDRLNLLSKILPEVHAMKYFKQDLTHHPEAPDTLGHTLKAIELLEFKPWQSKIATLFHDIGKTRTFDDQKEGKTFTYYRHEIESANLTRQICERLKFSSYHTEQLIFAVENHMKFQRLASMKPSKVARIVNSPHFETLVDVCYADEFARREKFIKKEEFQAALNRAYEVKEKWENRVINSNITLVSGKLIMEVLGIRPGKSVGRVKRIVEDAIINQDIDPDDTKTIHDIILKAFLLKEEEE